METGLNRILAGAQAIGWDYISRARPALRDYVEPKLGQNWGVG
ncbi:hypothetical protein QS257_18810 [Terrilactibacillus sp. S3-3]|nr:hypothetical protein QS257_18810 [Terrilactibacillus sp. S3-3]